MPGDREFLDPITIFALQNCMQRCQPRLPLSLGRFREARVAGIRDHTQYVPNGRQATEFEGKGKANDARTGQTLCLLVFSKPRASRRVAAALGIQSKNFKAFASTESDASCDGPACRRGPPTDHGLMLVGVASNGGCDGEA